MKQVNIDLILIRFFQFILFTVFIFIVMVYFATLLLIPLDLLFQLQRILVFVGIPAVLSVLLTGGFVSYVGYTLWNKPEIWNYLLDTGKTLFNFAVEQVKGMEQMANAAKQQSTQD
jgi:nucleoside recognition membrane protein YjiH